MSASAKFNKLTWSAEDSLKELGELASGAGAEVISSMSQKLVRPSQTYMGSGKIEEIRHFINENKIDTVICDDELEPSQQLSMESALGDVKVIDRTALILHIFAARAQSKEGRLQVGLAQHEYLLPRLAGQWTHLERVGGGIGTRGPGESQIETDRRLIRGRIQKFKKDLEKVRQHRSRYRDRRKGSEIPVVALAGYTNAGKSSVLNMLAGEGAKSENRLFSTLDPVTRRIILNDGSKALLTDTVGFIQKLPTTLIAAFRATLEEAAEADLILHVIDVSHANRSEQAHSVLGLLKELKLVGKPMVSALNKIDKFPDDFEFADDKSFYSFSADLNNAVFCSAKTGLGKGSLLKTIEQGLRGLLD